MMNLTEYRKAPAGLADFLPWAALIAPGVVLNKDGSFQRTARFRGPDLDSATPAELIGTTARLNNALRRLGSGWAIFVEAQRSAANRYPESRFPDPVSALVDSERRAQFEEEGAHFESRYFLTLLFLPPAEDAARAEGWGADEDVMARLVKKTLFVGFFAFIIGNFNNLAKIIFNSFAGLGLEAVGSTVSANDFVHPGKIAQVGLDAGKPILTAAGQLMGFSSFFDNFILIFILMLAWVIVMISFFILAIQLFVTLIEFKLTTLAGFVLVPFGLFNKTAFLAEKVLGNVVASGVKVLVLAVIVGIGTTLFAQFTTGFPSDPNIEDALSIVLGSLTLLGLGIFGPGIATGLISGAPQLGAGAAVGTALAAGGIGVAGFMGTAGAVRAGAGAIAAGARGGAALAGGASTAYRLGAAASGESGMKGAAAGMAGVAKTGVSAAASIPRTMVSRIASNLKESFAAGGQAAVKATGGQSSGGSPGGAPSAASSGSGAPDWAKRMQRRQAAGRGVSTAIQTVRSGDHGGGSTNIDLSEES